MVPKRFSVKFFLEEADSVKLEQFVPIFQRWIQDRTVAGLLIDVADYKHLHHGPGVILVGHEADYALDVADGRPGLHYKVKRHAYESLEQALANALRLAAAAAKQLEQEPSLEGLHFRLDQVEVKFIDALQFRNHAAAFSAILPDLMAFVHQLDEDATIERVETDARQPLTIRLLLGSSLSLTEHSTSV